MKTVLIVDDEELFAQAFAEGLMAHDSSIRVLTACNGRVATCLLASNKIDLLLTDLDMPEMDGIALTAYAARCHPHVPVFVITAFGSRQVSERLRPFKIVGLIDKPADLADLYDRIRRTLGAATPRATARGPCGPGSPGRGGEPPSIHADGDEYHEP
jgi:DNA-binding NarL/FixJ family response regulator